MKATQQVSFIAETLLSIRLVLRLITMMGSVLKGLLKHHRIAMMLILTTMKMMLRIVVVAELWSQRTRSHLKESVD